METRYYVFRELHNGETGAADYQKPDSFATLDEAKKKFHEYLSTYINYGKLDRVMAIIIDSYGNVMASEVWSKSVEEPEAEVEA